MHGHVLREPHYGSGAGFCYDVDRTLFRSGQADGPLLMALDSNIVVDTMRHGAAIVNDGEYPAAVSLAHRAQLTAWGEILEVWLIRDLRLIALPGMRDDHKGPLSPEQTKDKNRQLRAVEDALTFQLDGWEAEDGVFAEDAAIVPPATEAQVRMALSPLDASLVIEAARYGADVFLTQDKQLLNRMRTARLPGLPDILSPTELADRLESIGLLRAESSAAMFFAGHVDHSDCIYAGGTPLGDTGKWVPLLEALDSGR